jgi:hypothetical protein
MYVFVLMEGYMTSRLLSSNLRLARSHWKGEINQIEVQQLKSLTERHEFSVAEGDLIRLECGWYVTHTGLIRLANRNRCAGIHTKPVARFCDPQTHHWCLRRAVVGALLVMATPILQIHYAIGDGLHVESSENSDRRIQLNLL